MFDEAPRGPLGAATMVFRTGWGNLAVLGAVVMLGALVMEPFAQLIVRYPVRSVEAGIATVGRAQAYDSGRGLETCEFPSIKIRREEYAESKQWKLASLLGQSGA